MELTAEDIEKVVIDSFRSLDNVNKARVLAFLGSLTDPDGSFADLMPTIDEAYPSEAKDE